MRMAEKVPLVLIVDLAGDQGPTTCVLCDGDPTKGLYTHSWDLVGMILGTKDIAYETFVESEDVYRQLRNAGPEWCNQKVLSLTYKESTALGVGTNKKLCQRAARLALAASMYCDASVAGDYSNIPNPTHDYAFQALVDRVHVCRHAKS